MRPTASDRRFGQGRYRSRHGKGLQTRARAGQIGDVFHYENGCRKRRLLQGARSAGTKFRAGHLPLSIPCIKNGKIECYVDIVEDKAFRYEKGKPAEVAVPADIKEPVDAFRRKLSEAVAESNEELMEKFFMEEPFTRMK